MPSGNQTTYWLSGHFCHVNQMLRKKIVSPTHRGPTQTFALDWSIIFGEYERRSMKTDDGRRKDAIAWVKYELDFEPLAQLSK